MGKYAINLPKFTVVLPILLFLLSGIPNVSSQENPYAPEVDYFCDDNVLMSVEYQYYKWDVICSISNNNPHDVNVKISEEWEYNVDGPYEVSEYGYCIENEIGREIYVQGSSTTSFCYKISADKYTTEGLSILTSTAEVVSYSTVIPCNACEPVDEEVQVEILPWYTISYDYSATPESAYGQRFGYGSERIICDKSDFSELLLDLTVDGNFLGTWNLSVDFSFQTNILDLSLGGYVEYKESTFGEVNLEYDSEQLTLEAGETVRRSFKASWEIKEDTDNYDIRLFTQVDIYEESGLRIGSMGDVCPTWEGVLPTQEINLNNEPSEGSFNLSSSFSMPLSVISMVMAAVAIRKE